MVETWQMKKKPKEFIICNSEELTHNVTHKWKCPLFKHKCLIPWNKKLYLFGIISFISVLVSMAVFLFEMSHYFTHWTEGETKEKREAVKLCAAWSEQVRLTRRCIIIGNSSFFSVEMQLLVVLVLILSQPTIWIKMSAFRCVLFLYV